MKRNGLIKSFNSRRRSFFQGAERANFSVNAGVITVLGTQFNVKERKTF
jgi:hypothetical protein